MVGKMLIASCHVIVDLRTHIFGNFNLQIASAACCAASSQQCGSAADTVRHDGDCTTWDYT